MSWYREWIDKQKNDLRILAAVAACDSTAFYSVATRDSGNRVWIVRDSGELLEVTDDVYQILNQTDVTMDVALFKELRGLVTS